MSKNFQYAEFSCKCCKYTIINNHLQAILELVRAHFKQPVTITSATRCKTHNKNVGGKDASRHLTGEAADIVVKSTNPQKVYDYINSIFPYTLGLGNYDNFTHIDVRETHARW